MSEDLFNEDDIFTLTDEEGNEEQFKLIGTLEHDGNTYYALSPENENDSEEGEYVILKLDMDDDGEEILVTIDDDDEFEEVANIFDDELFSEIDYDGEDE